ncbi:MAG: 3-oxoacyl-ACP synthase [Bacteroidia bacterium]|nr:3-oxoacyl-ACP synthase [Bacteroidia bacterium]
MNQIVTYCKISPNQVWVNGTSVYKDEVPEELSPFLGKLYKHLETYYPKFFKMDKLCKLGVLATELVIRNSNRLSEIPKDKVALVFSNSASSLDTDRQHQQSISDKQNYFPSPSVFVYTLPNILLGEIAIKHKVTGENAFFVSRRFDPELMHSYTELLLADSPTDAVLCGWVNVDENSAEAFVYCVKKANFNGEKEGLGIAHSPENTQQLYNT